MEYSNYMSRKHIENKIVICKQCGKEFIVKEYSQRKFCSEECSRASWKGSHNKSVLVNCVICNKEFYALPSRLKEGKDKCCSKTCKVELMKTTSYLVTNNPSKTDKGKARLKLQNKGENAWNWKGGITPIRTQIYRSDLFRNWRKEVFKRDNWTCQECGTVGGNIHAHHIKSFADIIEDNNIKTLEDALKCEELGDINNGVCLCEECHKLTDTYGWKGYHRKNAKGFYATL